MTRPASGLDGLNGSFVCRRTLLEWSSLVAQCPVEIERCADQGQVGKRLGKISEGLAAVASLLPIEAKMITLIKKLLGWRHSGFSIHHQVRIGGSDQDGREKLAQYILRAPFSQQKMRYQPTSRTVIYRSKMHQVLKRNFDVFPVLDWIAAVTAHIPNKGEHLVRYYGWFSNVNRGKRRKAEESAAHRAPAGMVEIPPPPARRSSNSAGPS